LKNLLLNHNFISKVEGLENAHNLERLYLYDNRLTKIEGIGHLSKLSKVRFDGNYIPWNLIASLSPEIKDEKHKRLVDEELTGVVDAARYVEHSKHPVEREIEFPRTKYRVKQPRWEE
jgi:hypothetical protein